MYILFGIVYFRYNLMDHIDVIHKGLLKYPCKFCGQKMKSHAAKKYHQERNCPLRHQGESLRQQRESHGESLRLPGEPQEESLRLQAESFRLQREALRESLGDQ